MKLYFKKLGMALLYSVLSLMIFGIGYSIMNPFMGNSMIIALLSSVLTLIAMAKIAYSRRLSHAVKQHYMAVSTAGKTTIQNTIVFVIKTIEFRTDALVHITISLPLTVLVAIRDNGDSLQMNILASITFLAICLFILVLTDLAVWVFVCRK